MQSSSNLPFVANSASARYLIYTGDSDAQPTEILEKAKKHFGVSFSQPIEFVYLHCRHLVSAACWPRFTLIGQSLGSMILALEALIYSPPHLFFDTTGFAFTYIIAKIWFGCTVICYTHYPTISTDMLLRVQERRPTYNNDSRISQSVAASFLKLMYYKAFASIYGFMGRFSDLICVNSSWTHRHINYIWNIPQRTFLVYPPCPVQHLLSSSSLDLIRSPHIISVGQFRPEKDHELQLRAFAAFISSDYIRSRKSQADLMKSNRQWKSVDSGSSSFSLFQSNHTPSAFQFDGRTKLFLIGGCRDAVDQARVAHLKSVAHTLGIEDSVEFLVNVDNTTLSLYLSTSLVCLHSMWNEHFGISCVESMASGTILIAHNSGGPRQDIVLPENGIETGYLASTPEEYAQHMQTIFESYYPPLTNASTSSWSAKHQHLQAVRAAARRRSQMFSDENFANSFLQTVRQVKI